MDNIFKNALHNFINDFASGDAVRHLANKGLTVDEIYHRLDYPTPKKTIADILWKHYIDTGKICLSGPPENGEFTRYKYVKDVSPYGRTTSRRVSETVKTSSREYVPCDFGKRLYQRDPAFLDLLDKLDASDKNYILDLPWPLETVYHEKDERIRRITDTIGDYNGSI